MKRSCGRGEIAQKAAASTASSRLHSREDLHELVQMVVTSTQNLASKSWREVLVACLALPVQSERMIQHDPAQVVHSPRPHKMASFLPVIALVGPELVRDMRSQIVLSC